MSVNSSATIAKYYFIGWADGKNNKPKQRISNKDNRAAYLNGYAEGHKERSMRS